MKSEFKDKIRAGVLGVAVGDALGVPVEFNSRESLDKNPVTNMREYGTYRQPKGTWSDDSSLMFCLMEGLCNGYNLNEIAQNFVKWKYNSYWTPHGAVFDIGNATSQAIYEITKGTAPEFCGGLDEWSNGNGSLMRILPMAFYLYNESDIGTRYKKVKEISSITHAHIRSVLGCFIYVEYALKLLEGQDKFTALQHVKREVIQFLNEQEINPVELANYDRILKGNIGELPREDISGSGYVVHSLEASLWCLFNANSYSEAVLAAVNLGDDTDTTAAITGGIAAIYFGPDEQFDFWKLRIARYEDVVDLINRFTKVISDEN